MLAFLDRMGIFPRGARFELEYFHVPKVGRYSASHLPRSYSAASTSLESLPTAVLFELLFRHWNRKGYSFDKLVMEGGEIPAGLRIAAVWSEPVDSCLPQWNPKAHCCGMEVFPKKISESS
ncbi:hypothetical protein Q31a_01880 [Aureliella helgolandensis]|uniref:Uncharacterized protein n=1 Tax=Aureliella helgolandensis TaxID=2527968 RepID=A0A518FZX4_9BACT|nr:hypothetical protein Q31a_01880 [Aureliella helgolandensis]